MSAVQISTKIRNCVLRCSTHFVYVRTHCRIQVESGTHVTARYVWYVTRDYCLVARQSGRLIAVFVRGVIDETLVQIVPGDPWPHNLQHRTHYRVRTISRALHRFSSSESCKQCRPNHTNLVDGENHIFINFNTSASFPLITRVLQIAIRVASTVCSTIM